MGKGAGLPRSQVRTHADKVMGSWAWQASSRAINRDGVSLLGL